jgi:hypothetical protein
VRPWTNTSRTTPQTSFQAQSLPRTRHTIGLNAPQRETVQPSRSVTVRVMPLTFESETGNTWPVVVQKGAKYE